MWCMDKPMQPPARQPLGFWTVRAGEAIRARTRGALADMGVQQPEWWVLHQLSLAPEGVERAYLVDKLGHNDTPEAIETALISVVKHGWATRDGDSFTLTDSGATVFAEAADLQAELQRERMQGITEEEFVTTITVLQRTIANVGGHAWHW